MANQVRVRFNRSLIGTNQKQRGTIEALGLRKLGQEKTFEDSATLRGMLNVVAHLVTWEEIEGETEVEK
jgi:large subunit ribosomal protein L30